MMDYPIVISPLSEDDGGGYVAYAVDLPGCMSDGETPEEAAANIQDAILEWLESNKERGTEAPKPGSAAARAEAHRKSLLETLNRTVEAFDGIDDRLSALEAVLEDIREHQDNEERWARFEVVTGRASLVLEAVNVTKSLPFRK